MCRRRGHYIELPSNIPYVTWNDLSNQITVDWLLLPLFCIGRFASALARQHLCNVGYDLAQADVFISCPCEDKVSESRAADDTLPCKKERSVPHLISCFFFPHMLLKNPRNFIVKGLIVIYPKRTAIIIIIIKRRNWVKLKGGFGF